MTDFKAGDKVRRRIQSDWPELYGEKGKIYTVLSINDNGGLIIKEGGGGANKYYFELVERVDKMKTWEELTPEEKGALLLAHHEGETIEFYSRLREQWRVCDTVYWSPDCSYRVKSESKEVTVWVNVFVNDGRYWTGGSCLTEERAKAFSDLDNYVKTIPLTFTVEE